VRVHVLVGEIQSIQMGRGTVIKVGGGTATVGRQNIESSRSKTITEMDRKNPARCDFIQWGEILPNSAPRNSIFKTTGSIFPGGIPFRAITPRGTECAISRLIKKSPVKFFYKYLDPAYGGQAFGVAHGSAWYFGGRCEVELAWFY